MSERVASGRAIWAVPAYDDLFLGVLTAGCVRWCVCLMWLRCSYWRAVWGRRCSISLPAIFQGVVFPQMRSVEMADYTDPAWILQSAEDQQRF